MHQVPLSTREILFSSATSMWVSPPMNICDEDICWLCSMPGSCCNCEFSDFTWSTPTSQESCAFNDRKKQANFDVDEPASHTTDGNCFLGDSLEDLDPEMECAASIPKNNDYAEKWESPGARPPPDSSSPVGLGTDSSPFSTDAALSMSRREDVIEGRLLFCSSRDGGSLGVKAAFNDRVPAAASMNRFPSHSSTPKLRIQEVSCARTDVNVSLQVRHHLAKTSEGSPSAPSCSITQGLHDEPPGAIQVAEDETIQGICAMTTRTIVEQTNKLEKPNRIDPVSARRSLLPAFRKRAVSSGPTILNLATSADPEFSSESLQSTENDRPHGSMAHEINGNIPSKMPRRVSIISASCLAQATLDNSLKRRRPSVDCLPEAKKVKLDQVASHVSCVSDSSVEFEYQATEPASIRRARSLRSEFSCSEESTDSLFYPSPLSSPTFRPCPDEDYPPTVPSTPLPNSVDYARSKANFLARTVAVYRRRSFSNSAIPPVPIIAPPTHITPTIVHCAEDRAIDRLHALLLRERSERERDGLNAHDEVRAERLKATHAVDRAFSRRDSASTSDSSDAREEWEEESTCSVIESQEGQDSAPSVKILPRQHRLLSQETWSNALGIASDFRKEVTGWILKKLPKEPASRKISSGDERHLQGVDLYDQLTNSRQTRFHAAQLFQRYFLLSKKAQLWREACKHERFEWESWISRTTSHWKRDVWELAVACIALSVKLHRDCLPPLGPVYASEFLDMAPYSMTHAALELAQRDVMFTFEFLLGSCTPQDVLDELWDALPTLRKATAPIRDGWVVVQCVTWDKLFESLFEPDMLQYPVSLLTAAALVESLVFALARHYKAEAEANVCKCKTPGPVPECVPDDTEPTSWQIHHFEANQLADDVILDVRDVLQLSEMELDECRTWLSYVGQE